MERLLKLALNKFDTIPRSLYDADRTGSPVTEVTVSLASLYHHYYLDSYGQAAPDPYLCSLSI